MRGIIFSLLLFSVTCIAETDFQAVLNAAESGDSNARVLVAYTYYFGEYRDGTKVEEDIAKAYAWASLANYQGHPDAKKLVNSIILKLKSREVADALAGEYFKKYGAVKDSAN
ncbi:SEL1-like repeat protein [Teredinibacter purpureus]|uniref:hypothetical protein n=1 Tax=Teredinibacter purpureus TaxID=2731756 RepID=UPI0006975BB6|nr:hypothetical protein [Teredinibacter purpureus]